MLEYIVVIVPRQVVRRFVPQSGRYQKHGTNGERILRSVVFPGLWLDVAALLRLDGQRAMDTLRQGLAIPEHAAFMPQLQERHEAP